MKSTPKLHNAFMAGMTVGLITFMSPLQSNATSFKRPDAPTRAYYTFTARVTNVVDDTGRYKSSISVGDIVTGTYSIQLGLPDSFGPDPYSAQYAQDLVADSMEAQVGQFIFPPKDLPPYHYTVEMSNVGPNGIPSEEIFRIERYHWNGVEEAGVQIELLDGPEADALSNSELTAKPPKLARWTSKRVLIYGGVLNAAKTGYDNYQFDAQLLKIKRVTSESDLSEVESPD